MHGIPPLTVTNFVVSDEGSANPRFLRPTLHAAPHDGSFLRDSGLLWGASLSPLNNHIAEEEAVPCVADHQPMRCKRCRAYINSFCQFVEMGRRWVCPFCTMPNDVEPEFFCNLDPSGKRRDSNDKPDLSRGSVEYSVDNLAEYAARNEKGEPVPTKPMHHLIAIDVSRGAKLALPDVVENLRSTLHQMAQKYPMCLVSFITYASSLHFYDFHSPNMPQLIVPDVENPFVPLPFTLLCWMKLDTDMDRIDTFLSRVATIAEKAEEDDCALGAVVKVSSLILSETGGKVIITASALPKSGAGAIKEREVYKLYGTEAEKQLFKPIEGFWPSISIECAKKAISFDLLMFPTKYCELMTIGQICHLTNGSQHLFLNYSGQHDQHRLQAALERSLIEGGGYAGILRVRCSSGIKVKEYHGHFLSQEAQDMDLACVQSSSTFFFELEHESKLDVKQGTFIQCALLYTTRCGHRRIRVHTLRMTTTNTHGVLFRNADLEVMTSALCMLSVHDAVNRGLKAARDSTTSRVVDLLVAYRRNCSGQSHTGQLLLPEQLKLLPLYALCLLKSDALVVGTEIPFDERCQCMFTLMGMPLHRLLYFLYPKCFALHNTLAQERIGTISPETNAVVMPNLLQLTSDSIMTHGVYALHDQQANTVYLWVGSQVTPRISQALFGVDDATAVGSAQSPFEQWNDRLRNVLLQMMRREEGMDRLLIAHEKRDTTEEAFFRNMLEDEAVPGTQSTATTCATCIR